MKRYELHLHTNHSKCSSNKPEKVLKIAKSKGFNGIVVTDHNTISGALAIKKLNKDKNFEVVVGEEVATDIGHVLVYYVKRKIKPGKVEDVIKEAKKQKAICVLAHPYNLLSKKLADLLHYKKARGSMTAKDKPKTKLFDAVEIFNSRCLFKSENKMAEKLAKEFKKPIIAGSDAHFYSEIGSSTVRFDRKYSLKDAILKGKLILNPGKRYVFLNRMRSLFLILFRKN